MYWRSTRPLPPGTGDQVLVFVVGDRLRHRDEGEGDGEGAEAGYYSTKRLRQVGQQVRAFTGSHTSPKERDEK